MAIPLGGPRGAHPSALATDHYCLVVRKAVSEAPLGPLGEAPARFGEPSPPVTERRVDVPVLLEPSPSFTPDLAETIAFRHLIFRHGLIVARRLALNPLVSELTRQYPTVVACKTPVVRDAWLRRAALGED